MYVRIFFASYLQILCFIFLWTFHTDLHYSSLNLICLQFIIVVLTFVLSFSIEFVGFQASTLIFKAQVSNLDFV